MGIVILLQMAIIRECLNMKGHVSASSLDLKTEMGNVGTLLDEALDFLADNVPPQQGMVANTLQSPDIKEMILGTIMNRMMMPSEHASQKQEERQVRQEQPKTLETETESN